MTTKKRNILVEIEIEGKKKEIEIRPRIEVKIMFDFPPYFNDKNNHFNLDTPLAQEYFEKSKQAAEKDLKDRNIDYKYKHYFWDRESKTISFCFEFGLKNCCFEIKEKQKEN